MKFVVDTSMWVAELARHDGTSDTETGLESLAHVYATDVICAELLAAPDNRRQAALVNLLAARRRVLHLGGMEDMRRAGACMRSSRLAGRTVRSMTDCLIAAICIRERIPLLHNDRDFDTLAELTPLTVIRH